MSYIAGFLTFMSIGGFPSFVEDMKVIFVSTIFAVEGHQTCGHWLLIFSVLGFESPTLSLLQWYVARSEISRACSSSAWACIADSPLEQHATTHCLLWVACFTILLECQVWKVNTQSCWRHIWTCYMACAGVLSWEAKWALWSGSICDRQHIFITAIPFPDIIDICINMLLYGRSASGVGPFCLFCSHAVCMCGVRGEPDDGCC